MNTSEAPRGNTSGPLSFPWKVLPISRRRRPSAPTRIELATVVVVTGLVAALIHAAYRTQRVRNEVNEGVAMAETIAPLIVDSVRRGDGVPAELSAAIPIALRKTLPESSIGSVTIVDGRIDVVFDAAADGPIAGRRISLTPYETVDEQVVWVCGNDVPGPGLSPLGFAHGGPQAVQLRSTIEARYLPLECR
jgi:hypothetical protein